jgi:LacI family transcriptional regulator
LGESAAVRDRLRAANLPVAVVAAGRPPTDAINVRIDDRQASQAMARHLLDLGHRRIGFIAGNPNQTASVERLEGARAAIGAVPGAELVLAQGAFTYDSGLRAAEQLLDADPPPTAIFASNDDMAAAAVSVAHRRHLDVPRDLTVVGFDDTTVATTLWPPLTTIRQPVRQMAAVALDRLMRALRSTDPSAEAPAEYVLDHVLIARESTAPPRPIAGAKAHERSSHA